MFHPLLSGVIISSTHNTIGAVLCLMGSSTHEHQKTNTISVSVNWTPQEQAALEDAFPKYASVPSIVRYAKIAVKLRNKTVRDVAVRCRWMSKKEISKRRKKEINARKMKDRKCMSGYNAEDGLASLAPK